jgi:hypothetical protein
VKRLTVEEFRALAPASKKKRQPDRHRVSPGHFEYPASHPECARCQVCRELQTVIDRAYRELRFHQQTIHGREPLPLTSFREGTSP